MNENEDKLAEALRSLIRAVAMFTPEYTELRRILREPLTEAREALADYDQSRRLEAVTL